MAFGCIFDDSCPLVHGIPVPLNARTGEIEALVQATIWSLTHLGYYPIEVYYDAISVGHAGTGQWNFPKDDKHAKTLRALMQYAEMYHDQGFTGHHVKAHTGILGNEVANFLAQYARTAQATVLLQAHRRLTWDGMSLVSACLSSGSGLMHLAHR